MCIEILTIDRRYYIDVRYEDISKYFCFASTLGKNLPLFKESKLVEIRTQFEDPLCFDTAFTGIIFRDIATDVDFLMLGKNVINMWCERSVYNPLHKGIKKMIDTEREQCCR